MSEETREIRIYEAPEGLYNRLVELSKKMANVSISKLALMLLDEALTARGIKEKKHVS
jgi:hypothetical protein